MAIHTGLRPFALPFTALATPVWRVGIEEAHKIPAETVTGVEINGLSYRRAASYAELRADTETFLLENPNSAAPSWRLLVHFGRHDPPAVFRSLQFRVQFRAEAEIQKLAAWENGASIVGDPDTNIIVFREKAAPEDTHYV